MIPSVTLLSYGSVCAHGPWLSCSRKRDIDSPLIEEQRWCVHHIANSLATELADFEAAGSASKAA